MTFGLSEITYGGIKRDVYINTILTRIGET